MTGTLLYSQVNGQAIDHLSVLDRGLSYGHGLFETIRFADGVAPLWRQHLNRLQSDARKLGIPINAEQLQSEFSDFEKKLVASGVSDATIKLVVTAGVGGRGYAPPDALEPTHIFQAFSYPPIDREHYLSGITVKVCQYRLPVSPYLAGIKHLNRLDQVLARSEWKDRSIHEGLMLDQRGYVIEGTSSNLFAVINGELVTPDLSLNGVQGVMRRLVVEVISPALGMSVSMRDLSVKDLANASELFLCNALMGVRPVHEVLDVADYSVGGVTLRVQAELGRQFTCYQV